MSEHLEQRNFFQYCNIAANFGWEAAERFLAGELPKGQPSNCVPELLWAFAIPNGGFRNKSEAARLKAEGVKSGVADIFLPVPRGNYAGLFIEMKVSGGRVSPEQKLFGEFVIRHHYCFHVCYGCGQAAEVLRNYWFLA